MSNNTKRTFIKMYPSRFGFSAGISEKSAFYFRALADEIESLYNAAKAETREGEQVKAGFINLSDVNPERAAEWGLPEGTKQLSASPSKRDGGYSL